MILRDRHHLGMPVWHAVSYARCRIDEPHQTIAVKGSQDQSSYVGLGNKQCHGPDIDIRRSPGFALKQNTSLEFGDLGKRPDCHVGTFSDLAFCQSASISSRLVCSRAFPCLASSVSMYCNRALNLRLAAFRAD